VHLVSDLARLTLARDYLAQGYDRALWVDADVVVFDPDALALDPPELPTRSAARTSSH
jgi:hypothetical protein